MCMFCCFLCGNNIVAVASFVVCILPHEYFLLKHCSLLPTLNSFKSVLWSTQCINNVYIYTTHNCTYKTSCCFIASFQIFEAMTIKHFMPYIYIYTYEISWWLCLWCGIAHWAVVVRWVDLLDWPQHNARA